MQGNPKSQVSVPSDSEAQEQVGAITIHMVGQQRAFPGCWVVYF